MSRYIGGLVLVVLTVVFLSSPSVTKAEEGMLGGEFAATIGAQVGPFKTGVGPYFGGEIGLPLMELGYGTPFYGRLMGLVNINWAKTDDDVTFEPTVNALVPGALATQESIDLTTVTIILGLKYKFLFHDIVQPYVLAGPGIDIFFNDSDPGDLPGGIAPQPTELTDRGFPSGQGNVLLGLHLGGGVDVNVTKKIFVGVESRYNWVDETNGAYGVFGGRLGFRF